MRTAVDRMRERAEIAERDRGILLRHVARLREAAEWRLWHGHTPHCRARLSRFSQACNCGHDHLQRVVRETDPLTTLPEALIERDAAISDAMDLNQEMRLMRDQRDEARAEVERLRGIIDGTIEWCRRMVPNDPEGPSNSLEEGEWMAYMDVHDRLREIATAATPGQAMASRQIPEESDPAVPGDATGKPGQETA